MISVEVDTFGKDTVITVEIVSAMCSEENEKKVSAEAGAKTEGQWHHSTLFKSKDMEI